MRPFVLLVEDNLTDEKLTLRAFRDAIPRVELVVTRDGAEALDLVFATGPFEGGAQLVPALVLLDLKLPRVDGLEVLRRLRADERTRFVPVVILTTSTQDQDVRAAYLLGANAYVRKPVDFAEFGEVARVLVKFWLAVNLPPPPALPRP